MRGWTLIEVLVALALWGLITALLVRGFDVIIRSEQQQTEQQDQQARLQSALAQWQTDLNQMDASQPGIATMDWNGQVLRLLRRSTSPHEGGRVVVAWGVHQGRWVRWQSAPFYTRAEGVAAWDAATLAWSQGLGAETAPLQASVAASGWQVLFFRNDAWSNALSSLSATDRATPDAIRLQLELNANGSWQGPLQWDWVRPSWSANRS
jgi:general secretion pathway protein J